jgi:hypothetical protein
VMPDLLRVGFTLWANISGAFPSAAIISNWATVCHSGWRCIYSARTVT